MTENTYCKYIYIYTSHFFTIYIYRFTFTVSTFYRFTALQCAAFASCAFFSCAGVGLRTEVNWLIFTQSSVLKTPRRNCNHIYIYIQVCTGICKCTGTTTFTLYIEMTCEDFYIYIDE